MNSYKIKRTYNVKLNFESGRFTSPREFDVKDTKPG